MTGAARTEILSSLVSVQAEVARQVEKLDRYRALQAIEKTIAEFPGLEDLTENLTGLRDGMQAKLAETREVRALRTIERIMPDLSEVLEFLSERSVDPTDQIEGSGNSSAASEDAGASEREVAEPTVSVAIATTEVVAVSDIPQAGKAPQFIEAELPTPLVSNFDPGESPAPSNDAAASAPSVSYGIAQFLNPDDPGAGTGDATRDESLAQFRTPPPQEGRAA